MTLEEKIQNAEKVEIHYKPPYKTTWAIVEYFGQRSKPLKVVSYYTYGEELITGKPLICYHWLPSTNFVIIEDSFTTEAEAITRMEELKLERKNVKEQIMGKVRVCDKCKRVLNYTPDTKIKIYYHPYGDMHYELCSKCTEELKTWLNSSSSLNVKTEET